MPFVIDTPSVAPPVIGGDLTIGRIVLPTLNDSVTESLGSDLTLIGDQTAASTRRPRSLSVEIPVQSFDQAQSFVTAGNRLRRQVRSLMQNDRLRLAGIYLAFGPDPDLSGWLVIGSGDLAYDDGGVSYGSYKLTLSQVSVVGTRYTHRPALRAVLKDLRLSSATVDADGSQVGIAVGFAAQPTLPIVPLPPGAIAPTVLARPATVDAARVVSDGAVPLITGLNDGDVVVYDRAESDMNKGDVVIVNTTTGGVQEEVYGPDYPLTDGTVPTLQNGACRVTFDQTGVPGFVIDAWNPALGGYVSQGKATIVRGGDVTAFDARLVGASVREWTPDRGVLEAQLQDPLDAYSYERVVITLQRGWAGPRFEVYSPTVSSGTVPTIALRFVVAAVDPNFAAVKLDPSAQVATTAGTGTPILPDHATTLGASSFTGENHVTLLRDGAPNQATFAVLQPSAAAFVFQDTGAYGVPRNALQINVEAGYVSVHTGFIAQGADQAMEAEAIIFTGSTTTSIVSDATASGGSCVQDTQTALTNFTLAKMTPALAPGKYRAVARVKVASGVTGSFKFALSGTYSTTVATTTSTSWVWVDLGETAYTNGSVDVAGWTNGSGSVFIDRVQLLRVEDRAGTQPTFAGARDIGQAALVDARVQPRLVTR